eukprot:TRINITY_DN588_c0_g1_i2.p3 TRINITY_DN588_c0_g1~~TRINITY_DN588_c0_g1_i2.p3  ORF type:complete len:117 (+),score=14.34 TRINITY_DN588_c0_g1_i2:1059-1409(+)
MLSTTGVGPLNVHALTEKFIAVLLPDCIFCVAFILEGEKGKSIPQIASRYPSILFKQILKVSYSYISRETTYKQATLCGHLDFAQAIFVHCHPSAAHFSSQTFITTGVCVRLIVLV